jgi:hypothetical protein
MTLGHSSRLPGKKRRALFTGIGHRSQRRASFGAAGPTLSRQSGPRRDRTNSSGDDIWDPGVGQLQFRGMDSGGAARVTVGNRDPARPEPLGDTLQCVPRCDLSLAASVNELADAGSFGGSCCSTARPQVFEALAIDRLKRQTALKSGFGGGVELPGSLERPLALKLGPVASEADRLLPQLSAGRQGSAHCRLLERFTTRGAERARPWRLELTARQRGPVVLGDHTVGNSGHGKRSSRRHEFSLGEECDRSGHNRQPRPHPRAPSLRLP